MGDVRVRAPEPLRLKHNEEDPQTWTVWRQVWSYYATATNLAAAVEGRTAAYRVAVLMSTLGADGVELYSRCEPPATVNVKNVLDTIEAKIKGERNETFEKYRFNTCNQKDDETVESYVM